MPWSSMMVARLAVGVEDEAEVGAGRAHEIAQRLHAGVEIVAGVAIPTRGRVRVHAQHRGADLRRARCGMTTDAAPYE